MADNANANNANANNANNNGGDPQQAPPAMPSMAFMAMQNRTAQLIPSPIEPRLYRTVIKYCFGGPDPLDWVSFRRYSQGENGYSTFCLIFIIICYYTWLFVNQVEYFYTPAEGMYAIFECP